MMKKKKFLQVSEKKLCQRSPRKVIRNFLSKRACEKAAELFVAKVNKKIFTLAVENTNLSSV